MGDAGSLVTFSPGTGLYVDTFLTPGWGTPGGVSLTCPVGFVRGYWCPVRGRSLREEFRPGAWRARASISSRGDLRSPLMDRSLHHRQRLPERCPARRTLASALLCSRGRA